MAGAGAWPLWLWKLPFVGVTLLMALDEFVFHHRRGLKRWEALGHPVDTASVLALLALAAFGEPTFGLQLLFLGGAVFSCVLITKDEWVHVRECAAGEQQLHALLFILHPVLLFGVHALWVSGDASAVRFLRLQTLGVGLFGLYQLLYWRKSWSLKDGDKGAGSARNSSVNQTVYGELGDRWYTATDDPIALLRAESRFRNPWILQALGQNLGRISQNGEGAPRVLDLGCGGGFLANALAEAGYRVTGLDQSPEALEVARRHDWTGTVEYRVGDALRLPFETGTFEAVALMDFLEHVEDPEAVLREVSRVLKPGGLWFFHTFNRTRVADWVAIRAVEAFVANVPENLHLLRLFIRPQELRAQAGRAGLSITEIFGARPSLNFQGVRDLFTIARTGRVPETFRFVRTSSLAVGYLGVGRKEC
jgi:2-polyprenyl-6-hydroxyphenyl methylase/3-demethylubiquinone-9 3-methyltransferase